jgi:LiaI-LiaF-like transmembrane region
VRPRNFDPASLASGLAVCALGVLLLLDQTDVIDLRFGYLWPALLATIGTILLAVGLTGKRR